MQIYMVSVCDLSGKSGFYCRLCNFKIADFVWSLWMLTAWYDRVIGRFSVKFLKLFEGTSEKVFLGDF